MENLYILCVFTASLDVSSLNHAKAISKSRSSHAESRFLWHAGFIETEFQWDEIDG